LIRVVTDAFNFGIGQGFVIMEQERHLSIKKHIITLTSDIICAAANCSATAAPIIRRIFAVNVNLRLGQVTFVYAADFVYRY